MKIAISGASGWLARSAFAAALQLQKDGFDVSTTLFSTNPKTIELRDGAEYTPKELEQLWHSDFDLYVPLAFLTREKYDAMGGENYRSQNLEIIRSDSQFLEAHKSMRVLLISSGSVTRPSQLQSTVDSYRCYADLKKYQENEYRRIIGDQNLSVCYLFSCTSIDIPHWQNYAFSSIIHDVICSDRVVINNPFPVYRRYVDARELFYVMFRDLHFFDSFKISSGGPLIELGELANLAITRLKSKATVTRAKPTNPVMPDNYFTSDHSMENLFLRNHFKISSIEKQILQMSWIFRATVPDFQLDCEVPHSHGTDR